MLKPTKPNPIAMRSPAPRIASTIGVRSEPVAAAGTLGGAVAAGEEGPGERSGSPVAAEPVSATLPDGASLAPGIVGTGAVVPTGTRVPVGFALALVVAPGVGAGGLAVGGDPWVNVPVAVSGPVTMRLQVAPWPAHAPLHPAKYEL